MMVSENYVKMPVGQSFMRSRVCTQLENEEEEESWREGDQMAVQFGVRTNGPELFVHECMSQGMGVKEVKEKKKVLGWSTENGVSQWRKILKKCKNGEV